jgi:hypothetical protein
MKIGKGERVYTSYIFKLRDGSFVKVLAKELVNGKLDLVMIGQYGNEKRNLLEVKEVDKENYEEFVSYITKSFSSYLLKVEVIYPQVFEIIFKKKND